jgi:hypothetical protein
MQIDRIRVYKAFGLLGFALSVLLILAITAFTFSTGSRTNTSSRHSVATVEWK